MEVSLTPELENLIDAKVRSGEYATAADVIRAGLASLVQEEAFGDFAPGEFDALIAIGERSIAQQGTIAAEDVFTEIRQQSAAGRGSETR